MVTYHLTKGENWTQFSVQMSKYSEETIYIYHYIIEKLLYADIARQNKILTLRRKDPMPIKICLNNRLLEAFITFNRTVKLWYKSQHSQNSSLMIVKHGHYSEWMKAKLNEMTFMRALAGYTRLEYKCSDYIIVPVCYNMYSNFRTIDKPFIFDDIA